MSISRPVSDPQDSLSPEQLDHRFPPDQQRTYVSMLLQRSGLTRRRAECFVRLWAYLFLKQQQEKNIRISQPLTQLGMPEGFISCTHREAAELFYGNQDRGSDRAAGMMIDRLMGLGLLEKRFDGQTLCLQIRQIPELALSNQVETPVQLYFDMFNPRTDAIPIANLLTRTYTELVKDSASISHKMMRVLRQWGQQYPAGMRVLRRSDNSHPVGACVLYPIASESEFNFFQSPCKSFYLTTDTEIDPFKMATPGDPDCTVVYIRAWVIDHSYLNGINVYRMLEDTRQTLVRMQSDFPNLCDVYSLIFHPMLEELRLALGFQKLYQDNQRAYSWAYLGLDNLLKLDLKQALANLRLGENQKA